MHVAFLDASKAFDRVNRCKLLTKLENRGVAKYILRLISYDFISQHTLTGRTLTGLLQARHVGQRVATTLQNRHGTPLASAENAARRTTSRRSADTTLP